MLEKVYTSLRLVFSFDTTSPRRPVSLRSGRNALTARAAAAAPAAPCPPPGHRRHPPGGRVLPGPGSRQQLAQGPARRGSRLRSQAALSGGHAPPLQCADVPSHLRHQPSQAAPEAARLVVRHGRKREAATRRAERRPCGCGADPQPLTQPHRLPEVGPASMVLGNLVSGKRIAQASGRELAHLEDSDQARKVRAQRRAGEGRVSPWGERVRGVSPWGGAGEGALSPSPPPVPVPAGRAAVAGPHHPRPPPVSAAERQGEQHLAAGPGGEQALPAPC